MELSPLRSAALGLVLVALVAATVSQSTRLAAWLTSRFDLRPGLQDRCRTYALVNLGGAILLGALSGRFG